jgi:hypothetical protein
MGGVKPLVLGGLLGGGGLEVVEVLVHDVLFGDGGGL